MFHGTARLVRPGETPAPPRPLRHDNVEGEFHGEFDLSFELLVAIGYVPVDPSHPAYPLYLAASTAPPSPPPAHALDPNHPDTVILPFDTVVNIPAERALQFGLMPPGWATGEAEPVAAPQPVRRRNVPPPVWTGPGSSADRHTPPPPPPPPIGDYDAFLRFLGDPDKHPPPGEGADASADRAAVTRQTSSIRTSPPNARDAGETTQAVGMVSPMLAGALPSTLMASADGIVAPAAGAVVGGLAAAGAEAASVAASAVLSSGAAFAAPAAILLTPSATAADDTLLGRGLSIGPPPGTRVDLGDPGADLRLGASAFTSTASPVSGSPPLLPPDTGTVQEHLPIMAGTI